MIRWHIQYLNKSDMIQGETYWKEAINASLFLIAIW